MIVFLYIFFIILFIIIITLLSNIKIVIKDIKIVNTEKLSNILKIILKEKDDRKKMDMLDYITFNIKTKILIFNVIPIIVINIDNIKAKQILINQYDKEIRKNRNIEEDKKQAKQIINKLLKNSKLEKTNIKLEIGTDDAALTALITSILNILISIYLPYVANVKKVQNYKYKIIPTYLNKNVFFLQLSCIINIKILHILNVIWKREEIKI